MDLSRMSPDELDAEDRRLRVELATILDRPYFSRDRNRVMSIHYRLGYIEWAKAGKPQPQPRFV